MFLVSHKYDSLILQGSGFGANKAFRFYSMAVVNGKWFHAKSLTKRINHAFQTKPRSVALIRSFVDSGNGLGEGHGFTDENN